MNSFIYGDIGTWSISDLEDELENLYKDLQTGMDSDLYRDSYDIILAELFRREDALNQDEDFDRAMKGI